MNVVKKGLAFGMALMMAGSMAACAGGDTTWAAKAGDLTVPAGVYISQVMNAYYTVAAELPQDTKDPLKEQIDGVLASDKMISDAKANLNKFIAVEQKFNELGLTMSDADTTLVNQMADSYWQYLGEGYQANGFSKDSYVMMTANDQKRQLIFNAIYGEGGSEAVPEQELKDKFYNDFAKIILIPLNFSQSEDAEQKESDNKKAREIVDKYLKQAQAGKDMEEIVYEAQKEVTGNEELEKPEPGTSFSFLSKENTNYDQKVIDAVFGAENGVPTVVETESSIYLFQRYDITENENDFTSRKEALIQLLRADEFNAKLDEWAAAVSGVTYNDASFKRYTPDKLKL